MDEKDKRVIDPELLTLLNGMKTDLTTAVKESENHIKETLKLSIDPLKETNDRHTKDIDDLYNKDRDNRDRFGVIESDVKSLKEDKEDNKHQKEIRVGIWAIVVTIILGGIAGITSLFIK